MRKHDIKPYHFEGCAFGLISQQCRAAGKPIRKPWALAATAPTFRQLCRSCLHLPYDHVEREGADTRLTEAYTDPLVHAIHNAWRDQCDPIEGAKWQQYVAMWLGSRVLGPRVPDRLAKSCPVRYAAVCQTACGRHTLQLSLVVWVQEQEQ